MSRVKSSVIYTLALIGLGTLASIVATGAPAEPSAKPSYDAFSLDDVPINFKSPSVDRDYTRRVEMVPMRDGVKRYTIILAPQDARNAPILLTRTPYNAAQRAQRSNSTFFTAHAATGR